MTSDPKFDIDKFNKEMSDLYFKCEKDAKSARLRRTRGYSFEYGVVQKLKSLEGWDARRLGGSSTGLPDIVATYNQRGILLVMECKSKDANVISIPDDQVQRLMTTASLFGFYGNRWLVFAFKFKANKDDLCRQKLQYRFVPIRASTYHVIRKVIYNLRTDLCTFNTIDNNGEPCEVTKTAAKALSTLLSVVVS